jgi:hypothetical protein
MHSSLKMCVFCRILINGNLSKHFSKMLQYQFSRVTSGSRIVSCGGQRYMAKQIGKFLQFPYERWKKRFESMGVELGPSE